MKITILSLVILLLLASLNPIVQASDNNTSNSTANLTVEVVPKSKPRPSPGNGGAPAYAIKTDLFGTKKTFYTDYKGEVQKTIKATSEDGMLTITIPKGTVAKGKDGRRLRNLEVEINPSPPKPPWDACIIGLPYDFSPTGATFEPPITFTWSYDPNALPEGVAEKDLVLAYYIDGRWLKLECTVDTQTNIVTALVDHFTTFAMFGNIIPEPAPTPVVIPIPPKPPEPTPPVIVAPPPAPVIVPPIAPVPEPVKPMPVVPPVEPVTPTPVPWVQIYAAILIGLFIIGLVTFWLIKRKKVRTEGGE